MLTIRGYEIASGYKVRENTRQTIVYNPPDIIDIISDQLRWRETREHLVFKGAHHQIKSHTRPW